MFSVQPSRLLQKLPSNHRSRLVESIPFGSAATTVTHHCSPTSTPGLADIIVKSRTLPVDPRYRARGVALHQGPISLEALHLFALFPVVIVGSSVFGNESSPWAFLRNGLRLVRRRHLSAAVPHLVDKPQSLTLRPTSPTPPIQQFPPSVLKDIPSLAPIFGYPAIGSRKTTKP